MIENFKNNLSRSCYLFIVLFIFNNYQNAYAQWQYPDAKLPQAEIVINYEIVYDKVLTDAQIKDKDYCDNIVVVFNSNFMKEQYYFKNKITNVFRIYDFEKKIGYKCNHISKTTKLAIISDFIEPNQEVTILPNTPKTILNFSCDKATINMGSVNKDVYYTKALGLRYCKEFNVDGFILEYPGYSEKFGSFMVKAKSINYIEPDHSIYSLVDFKIYTEDTYKSLKNEAIKKNSNKRIENIGELAKKFNTRSIDGKKLSSKEMIGEVTVLNFWVTTFGYCKMEIPELNRLKEKYKDKKVNFIAFAMDAEYILEPFLRTHQFDYDVVSEAKFIAEKYGVTSYPTNIVIDKTGIIQLFESGHNSDIFERLDYQIAKSLN